MVPLQPPSPIQRAQGAAILQHSQSLALPRLHPKPSCFTTRKPPAPRHHACKFAPEPHQGRITAHHHNPPSRNRTAKAVHIAVGTEADLGLMEPSPRPKGSKGCSRCNMPIKDTRRQSGRAHTHGRRKAPYTAPPN
ncbi:hypothetical protein T440DRAFT_178147 [Plenodomus tracheiphilus IPT5]|uniref:Uncharacterized protein n=1 Tax=Plenodomus tracheiphilus IPT5 TaxID=1408161 RepID=A0A6A7B1D3_9PLEO|nr:hypothetical protein T440DRAFT_178147 [Plenodomus tracheiphilus IPT5]